MVKKSTYKSKRTKTIRKKPTSRKTVKKGTLGKGYLTHDNGGRKYLVRISEKRFVKVYRQSPVKEKKNDSFNPKDFTIMVKEIKNPKKIFMGKGSKDEIGNSILVQTGSHSYVFIGTKIFSFKTEATIKTFVSRVGNSDVPYPYAIASDSRVYLLIENVSFILDEIGFTKDGDYQEDPYEIYYDNKSKASWRKKYELEHIK
jgi:hypothetical protein